MLKFIDVQKLPEHTWQSLSDTLAQEDCHLDTVRFYWRHLGYDFCIHKIDRSCTGVKIIGTLAKSHSVFCFSFRMYLVIDLVSNTAVWQYACREDSRYQVPYDPFRTVHYFTGGGRMPKEFNRKGYRGTLDDFVRFLQKIDMYLTKLLLHPGREEFCSSWIIVFGELVAAHADQYRNYLNNLYTARKWKP